MKELRKHKFFGKQNFFTKIRFNNVHRRRAPISVTLVEMINKEDLKDDRDTEPDLNNIMVPDL